MDQPVGTGFSYSKTARGYTVDDFLSAEDSYDFLRKVIRNNKLALKVYVYIIYASNSSSSSPYIQWILGHPKFSSNPLYISGDSYSGKIGPMITLKVAKGSILYIMMFALYHIYIYMYCYQRRKKDGYI